MFKKRVYALDLNCFLSVLHAFVIINVLMKKILCDLLLNFIKLK